MRKKFFCLIFFCMACFFSLRSSFASSTPNEISGITLFKKPEGFWLISKNQKEKIKLYASTSAFSNWSVAQWDIPEQLPPFKGDATKNNFASFEFLNKKLIILHQNGAKLPCWKKFPTGKVLPDEFDLLFSPNGGDYSKFPQAFIGRRIPLANLSKAVLSFNLSVSNPTLINPSCPITWASAGVGFVLTNLKFRQALFYQISFIRFRGSRTGISVTKLQPVWFMTGLNHQSGGKRQYGFGDRAWASYKYPILSPGHEERIKIDILPRLKEILAQGGKQFKLDNTLSDWAITGEYFGQSVFGHMKFSSTWTVPNLTLFQN